jgi:hypothetical protein
MDKMNKQDQVRLAELIKGQKYPGIKKLNPDKKS